MSVAAGHRAFAGSENPVLSQLLKYPERILERNENDAAAPTRLTGNAAFVGKMDLTWIALQSRAE